MILPKCSGTFFNGFSELSNYSCNSRATNFVAIVKIFLYCTLIIPATVYILSDLCDRIVYNKKLSDQSQRVDDKAQEWVFGQKDNHSRSQVKTSSFSNNMASGTASESNVPTIKMPSAEGVEEKTLYRNGVGIRSKYFVKVYKTSLWVEKQSQDPKTLISSDTAKSIRLDMLRDVPGDKISGAITEGFKNNSESQMHVLNERLMQLNSKFPSMKEGDSVQLTYTPEMGTTIAVRGEIKGTIKGKDFADALFSVWLGPNPVQDDLKTQLLGK